MDPLSTPGSPVPARRAQAQRIVMVGPVHPYRGGIAHFLETVYRGMAQRGHRVSAVTFSRQYPSLLFPGKTQYETEHVEDPILAPRRIDTLGPWSWVRAASAIAGQAPDAVIFKYWMPFFAPAFGLMSRRLRRKGVRVLSIVHNAIPHERRPGDLALSRWFLRSCDGLLIMSDAVRGDLARLGVRGTIRQVHHPLYDLFGEAIDRAQARAQLDLPADAPVMLFFGYVRRYKGLRVLLDALPAVLERLPTAVLVVAGEFYEGEAGYRALVRERGLEDHVRFHADYIPNDQVPAFFSAADVIVQPYVSATQSGVAQIAYQFGRSLVVTDVGGLAEIVPHEKAGLVVPPNDAPALSSAVVRFFEEGLRDRLEDGVSEIRAQYSWDRLYEALEELLAAER